MKNVVDIYPLSPMQQGMLFHSLQDEDTGMYVEQLGFRVEGDLNLDAFRRAWERIVDRHPIFRTAFVWEGLDQPAQVERREVSLPFTWRDWRALPPDEQRDRFEQQVRQKRSEGFALASPPLMDIFVGQTHDQQYEVLWSHHHIMTDAWCLGPILKEVFAFYEAFAEGREITLPLPPPYRNYIEWLQEQDEAEARDFWTKSLRGFTEPTTPGRGVDGVGGRAHTSEDADDEDLDIQQVVELSESQTQALKDVAKAHGLTLNTLTQGAWALLHAAYCGTQDIVFGIVDAGRPATLDGSDAMMGLFVNSIPIRTTINPQTRLSTWLKQLQAQVAEARQYVYHPLYQIQQWSDISNGRPLFESLLTFQNVPRDAALAQRPADLDLHVEVTRSFEHTNYPLRLLAEPGDTLRLTLSFRPDAYDRKRTEKVARHLETILHAIGTDAEQKILAVSPLQEAERKRQVEEWGRGGDHPRPDEIIPGQFDAQARQTPDRIAIVGAGNQHLTYAAFDRRAAEIAESIRPACAPRPSANGGRVVREVTVGLLMNRSVDLVAATLAVWRVGAAYVPIDVDYPDERVRFMVEDAGATVLCVDAANAGRLASSKADVGTLLEIEARTRPFDAKTLRNDASSAVLNADQVACIIYTSGSTGTPKGVAMTHDNLRQFVAWHCRNFNFDHQDRTWHVAGLSFDAAQWDRWPALTTGAPLYIAPEPVRYDPSGLKEWIERCGMTAGFLPTPLAERVLREPWTASTPVRLIYVGGAALGPIPQDLPFEFDNAYGTTEMTIISTSIRVETAETPTIGRPIDRLYARVFDENMRLLPQGVPGELYMGGPQVTRGYHGRPRRTAVSYVPDPYAESPGARLYRTGDRVRWTEQGTLDFLGRVDRQVQIRGMRVELSEIESQMNALPFVSQAAVVFETSGHRGEGRQNLIGYAVPSPESVVQGGDFAEELRARLQQRIPKHMVPAHVEELEAFPLTHNGKIDYDALPNPQPGAATTTEPQTSTEAVIAGIWESVLDVEEVGRDDNFFDLGGHSLLVVTVLGKLKEHYGDVLAVTDLFQYPTVRDLARVLDHSSQNASKPTAAEEDAESETSGTNGKARNGDGSSQDSMSGAPSNSPSDDVEETTSADSKDPGRARLLHRRSRR